MRKATSWKKFIAITCLTALCATSLYVPASAEAHIDAPTALEELLAEAHADAPTASERPSEEALEELPEEASIDNLPDADELLWGYLEQGLADGANDGMSGGISLFSSYSNRDRLTPAEQLMYDALKAKVTAVANGSESNTDIRSDIRSVLESMDTWKTNWTAEDLGVDRIVDIEEVPSTDEPQSGTQSATQSPTQTITINEEAAKAFQLKMKSFYDYSKVAIAVMRDCPYEFYWAANSFSFINPCKYYTYVSNDGEYALHLTTYQVYFAFHVAGDYAIDGASKTYVTDQTKTAAAATAIENARKIVEEAAGKTDCEILHDYYTKICDLVTYNHAAASASYTGGYGDPWQIIYLFDGDPTTNVVCEGYAKGFKYLCDMTAFESEDIYAILVSGNLVTSTKTGAHMWNIIHMDDGQNYIVDITNCDGTVPNDWLFIVPVTSGNYADGYRVQGTYGNWLGFVYDATTTAIYAESELTVSATPYEKKESSQDPEEPTAQEIEDENFTNVVVYVNFSDTTHEHTESSWGSCFLENPRIDKLFNGVDEKDSLYSYIKHVSDGNLRVKSIFPQLNADGTITPLQLPGTAASYAGKTPWDGLAQEVAHYLTTQGTKLSDQNLDYNQDGCIDNITIVVPCETGNSNELFYGLSWSYMGSDKVNGKEVGAINVITEGGAYLGLSASALPIHEFMHSIGFPDLYTVSGGGSPVGKWDIMSNLYMQYPLAYMRYATTDHTWVKNIKTVTTDQKGYSLYSPTAAGKAGATQTMKDGQALILKTGYSDDEFFVLEYRQKSLTAPYDNYLYGSGLIIYRINNGVEVKSNHADGKHYVYVFRPGDTYENKKDGVSGATIRVEAGKGDLFTSFLSAESGRTTYGTASPEASLADGAITYADGTNSGIVISNVGSAGGDTISFDISFTRDESTSWNTVANLPKSAELLSCTDDAGNLYVLNNENMGGSSVIYKLVKGGVEASNASASDNSLLQEGSFALEKVMDGPKGSVFTMDYYDGAFYIGYANASYAAKLDVKRIGQQTTSEQASDVTADQQTASLNVTTATYTLASSMNAMTSTVTEAGVMIAVEKADYMAQNIDVFSCTDAGCVRKGTDIARNSGAYPSNTSMTYLNGTLYLCYREAFANNNIVLMRYDGSSFSMLDDSMMAELAVLGSNDETLYMVAGNASNESAVGTYCYRWNGTAWEKIARNPLDLEHVDGLAISCSSNEVYVAASGDNCTCVYQMNLEGAVQYGDKLASTSGLDLQSQLVGNTMYVLYKTGQGNAVIRKAHIKDDSSEPGGGSDEITEVTLFAHSLELGDKVSIRYYFELPDNILQSADDVQVEFTKNGGVVKSMKVSEALQAEEDGHTIYGFDLAINAKEMGDIISLQFVYPNQTVSEVYNYSVVQYYLEVAEKYENEAGSANDSQNLKLLSLLKALLNYGSAAQVYFDYKADEPVNAILAEEDRCIENPDMDILSQFVNEDTLPRNEAIHYIGTSLQLLANMNLRTYFSLKKGENIEDYTFAVEDETKAPQDSLEDIHSLIPIAVQQKGDYYYVQIAGINSVNLNHQFTIQICKNGQEIGRITAGPFAYIRSVLAASTTEQKLDDVVKAIYWYNVYASNYFKNK